MDSLLPDGTELLVLPPMEEAEYTLKYVAHHSGNYMGQLKRIIEFHVIGTIHDGRSVCRYWNVDPRTPNEHSKQAWKPRRGSDCIKDLAKLFADRYDFSRIDLTRLPLESWFSSHLVIGKIVMVQHDGQGEAIHPVAQQAKVEKLIRIATDENGNDLTLPCLTLPNLTHPHLVENAGKLDQEGIAADWLSSVDREELGISEPTEEQKLIEKLVNDGVAETCEDIERLTGGRISADRARELSWYLP